MILKPQAKKPVPKADPARKALEKAGLAVPTKITDDPDLTLSEKARLTFEETGVNLELLALKTKELIETGDQDLQLKAVSFAASILSGEIDKSKNQGPAININITPLQEKGKTLLDIVVPVTES